MTLKKSMSVNAHARACKYTCTRVRAHAHTVHTHTRARATPKSLRTLMSMEFKVTRNFMAIAARDRSKAKRTTAGRVSVIQGARAACKALPCVAFLLFPPDLAAVFTGGFRLRCGTLLACRRQMKGRGCEQSLDGETERKSEVERGGEQDRQTETERQRDRDRDRETETETETERQRQRQRQRCTGTHIHTHTASQNEPTAQIS